MAAPWSALGSVSEERMTAHVTGRVQGVGFRWFVRRHAGGLGLVGWVMNGDDDRSVAIVAEGSGEALDELERLLRVGPQGARVESVNARRGPTSGEFESFGIVKS